MTLAVCVVDQKQFKVFRADGVAECAACAGDTAGAACAQWVGFYSMGSTGGTTSIEALGLPDGMCGIVNRQSTPVFSVRTVRQVCTDPDIGTVASRLEDMSIVWGLFLGAAIVILCVRKFANLWDRSPHVES